MKPPHHRIFLCRHLSGEPAPDNQETDRAAYLSLAEIIRRGASLDTFCAWIASRVLQGRLRVIPPQPVNPYTPFLGFFG